MDREPKQATTGTKAKPGKRGRPKKTESGAPKKMGRLKKAESGAPKKMGRPRKTEPGAPRKRGKPKLPGCGNKVVPKHFVYPCTECSMKYNNKYRFQMHCHKAHSAAEPVKDKLCTGCGMLFATTHDLARHRRNLHMEIPMMACHICNKQIRVSNLRPHLKIVHNDEKCTCEVCGIVLKNAKCLGAHMRGVHLKLEARQCDWPGCGRMFNRQTHLNTHMLTHTGELPIQC